MTRPEGVSSAEPLPFEKLGQANDYAVSRHQFDEGVHGTLERPITPGVRAV